MSRAVYMGGVSVCLACAVGVGVLSVRRVRAESAEASARREALEKGPRVLVAQAVVGDGNRAVTLQGEVKAWAAATLYAKVSGYVREMRVDKGDAIKRDQLLATLSSPETDQQVRAAEADFAIKQSTFQRSKSLLEKSLVSKQDFDVAEAALKVAQATVAQAKTLQSYTAMRAPFDGVVTARYVDKGALLSAATASTQSAQPVLDVADMSRLRIYVYLGQAEAAVVREGDVALVTSDQRREVAIQAKIDRLSRSLDPRTRTMLCEVDIDNRESRLYPGEFVHVRVGLKGTPAPRIPAEALILREGKLYVAVVADSVARLREVVTGVDDGRTVEITHGLTGDEWVALNAGADLADQTRVQAVRR